MLLGVQATAVKRAFTRVRTSVPAVEFRAWRKRRPFVGGVLLALSGIEMFFSSQLDLGKIHVSVGIAGLQSTVIPIALVTLGILAIATPVHRIFYGVIALAIAVYSLIGLNLGGFFVGMLLGAVGGVLVVSWMPKTVASTDSTAEADGAGGTDSTAPGTSAPNRRKSAGKALPLAHGRL
jgi:hypothetical protein